MGEAAVALFVLWQSYELLLGTFAKWLRPFSQCLIRQRTWETLYAAGVKRCPVIFEC